MGFWHEFLLFHWHVCCESEENTGSVNYVASEIVSPGATQLLVGLLILERLALLVCGRK